MTGLDLIVSSAAGAAAVLLLLAGAGHVRHRRMFEATLAAQKILPPGAQRAVAALMGPLELVLGAGLVVGLLAGGAFLAVAAVTAGLLYVVFGGYVALVWRTRPAVPCGCFASSGPASGWTVLRAALLGGACLALAVRAGAAGPGPGPAGLDDPTGAVLVAGGTLVLTGVCWLLPELTHLSPSVRRR